MPAALRRAFSQSGDGATCTPCRTRAVKRAQSAGSSIATWTSSPVGRSPVASGSRSSSGAQAQVEDRRDVARDAAHRQQVRAVREDLEVEHHVRQRDALGERLAGGEAVAEHHDAVVLVGDLELALGEDHPVRELAAQPRALELAPVGHRSPGSATATVSPAPKFHAPQTIWRGSGPPGVDPAELQSVGVRVRARLEHEPGEHETLDPVLLGQAATRDLLDLDARERDPRAELVERRQRIVQVGLQPADRHLHRRPPANCSRNRRSSS